MSFYDVVRELRDRGATVVLSSHALTELEERTERVIIMNQGIVVANGSIDDLRRIAELPAKIRLTVPAGAAQKLSNLIGPGINWRELNGHMVEFDAPPDQKVEFLRRATCHGSPVEDIAIVPPTLDDLYAHFLRTTEAAG
jgi:Cu-processing system ATP-binding protein